MIRRVGASRVVFLLVAVCAMLAVVTGAGASGPPVTFSATDVGAGIIPIAIAIGDLDGDGYPDLAVANRDSNNVSVLLNDGHGAFGPPSQFAVGLSPLSVAIADLNGDGHADLVTANSAAGTVSVLFGQAGGSFGGRVDYPTPFSLLGPVSVAVADLNGDGHPDIVSADFGTGTVSVRLGAGDGSFGARQSFVTGSNGNLTVAIGDVNSDGIPDIVVPGYSSNCVSVLLGHGDGTFGAGTAFNAGSGPLNAGNGPDAAAIGDVNGDGYPDIVTANVNSIDHVLLGAGDGTFGAPASFAAGNGSSAIAIGDLNGDGIPDLVNASNPVTVLLGNGDGSFGTATAVGHPSDPLWVAIGDLNGDGRPDVVSANGGANSVSVLLNTTTSADTTPPVPNLPTPLNVPATSAAGAPVNYFADATDDVDGEIPASCLPASGSAFPVGQTTVHCSATDAAHNSASGSFTVTIGASYFRASVAPTLVAAGSAANVGLTAFASNGQVLSTYHAPVDLSDKSGDLGSPLLSWKGGQGIGTVVLPAPEKNDVLIATDASGTGLSNKFNVYGPIASYAVTVTPTLVRLTKSVAVTALALDANGVTVPINGSEDADDLTGADATLGCSAGTCTGSLTPLAAIHGDKVTVYGVAVASGVSNAFDVYGSLDHFVVSASPSVLYTGQPLTVTATAFDANGSKVGNYSGSPSVSAHSFSSMPMICSGGLCTATPTPGVAFRNDIAHVGDGSAAGNSGGFTAIGPVSYFKVSVNPASLRVCTALSVGVTAFDAASNVIPNYHASLTATNALGGISGTVALNWTGGQGAGSVTPTRIGKDTLTVSNGAGATGISSPFAVTSGACV